MAEDTTRVSVVNPKGELVTLPADQVQDALARGGYSQVNEAQQAEIGQREKYGQGLGNELRAGVEGGARGLTFGLSDIPLGYLDEEGTRERKERNPTSALVGEGIGVGAGLLATGGASGAAGAGVRGVAELGELATAGAGRLLAGAAERGTLAQIAAKGLARGAGSAIEGAIYGGGQAISETALGESDDLGQALVAHVGLGALVGGGLGAGMGALGALGKVSATGTRSIARTLGFGKEIGEAAVPLADDAAIGAESAGAAAPDAALGSAPGASEFTGAAAAPQTFAERLSKGFGKIAHVVGGGDEATLADMTRLDKVGADFRKAYMSEHNLNDDGRRLADMLTANENDAEKVTEQSIGEHKLDRWKKVVNPENTEEQIQTAQMLIGKARQLVADGEREPGVMRGQKDLLAKFANDYEARISQAVTSGEDVGPKLMYTLDQFKRSLGPLAKPGARMNHAEFSFAGRVRQLYSDDFRLELESPKVWGEQAAELQREQNKVWTNYLGNKKHFDKHFMEEVDKEGWNNTYIANPGKTKGYLKGLGEAENDIADMHITQHVDRQEALVKKIRDLYPDMTPEQKQLVSNMEQRNVELRKMLTDMKREVGIKNRVEKVMQSKTGRTAAQAMKFYATVEKGISERFGRGPAAAAKMAAEEPEAYGAAVRMARRQENAAKLAGIEKANIKINKSLMDGVNSYIDRLGKGATRAAVPASVGAMHRVVLKPGEEKKAKTRAEAYNRRLDELSELTQNPGHLMAKLQASMAGMDSAAPKTSAQIQFTVSQALSFLHDKAPKNPNSAETINPLFSKWHPSESELSTFERYLHTAQEPLSILADLKNGTVTSEAVETVRTLYPSLFDKITKAMLPKLVEHETIPYQQRMQLSLMFGVSTDSTSSDSFWSTMQSMHQMSQVAAGPANAAKSAKNSRAEQVQTPLQRSISNT